MVTKDEQAMLDREYWFSEAPASQVGERFRLPRTGPRGQVETWRYISPLSTGARCKHCATDMVWPTRQARKESRSICSSCGHVEAPSAMCGCAACGRDSHEREEARRRRTERRHEKAWDYWSSELDTPEHVAFAWSRLSTTGQRFYAALVELLSAADSSVTWSNVGDRIGVRDADSYVRELELVGLICIQPAHGYTVNMQAGVPHGADWFEILEEREEARWQRYYKWWKLEQRIEAGDYRTDELFEELAVEVRGLKALLQDVMTLNTHKTYCDRDAWWGRNTFDGAGVQPRLKALLSEMKDIEEDFPLRVVYEVAHRHLALAMPICRLHYNNHAPVRAELRIVDTTLD